MNILGGIFLSTKGKYKCSFPIKLVDMTNKRLYTIKPKAGSTCNSTLLMTIDSARTRENGSLIEDLKFEGSCKNIAVVDFKNCINKSLSNVYIKRILFENLNEFKYYFKKKIKGIISITIIGALLIVIFILFALTLLKCNRQRIVIKVLKNESSEDISIKCSKGITTKVC